MVFNSYVFLFYFLPIVIALYYGVKCLPKAPLLLISSYIFYGWWKPEYMLLMLFSTTIDFFAGLALGKDFSRKTKRWILFISIAMNLGLLSYFKYFSFVISVLNDIIEKVLNLQIPCFPLQVPEIVLPIGISFYTFQSMSYTFDVYRGDIKPTRSFTDFAGYIALFPQLVAGPIVRAGSVLPDMTSKEITSERLVLAIHFFTLGLAKKVLLADPLGIACTALHEQEAIGFASAWISIYADVFHWYFDFSGYSDMAIGLGHLFGFSFPLNFNSPLKASSMTELVVKWHITLISWFRDYVYIPLGGNRKGTYITYRNLFLIMFLSGIWHGAGWTYIIWALMMSLALVVERAVGISRTKDEKKNWLTAQIGERFLYFRIFLTLTYYALCVSCFTSPNVSHFIVILKAMIGMSDAPLLPQFKDYFFLTAFILGGIIIFACKNTWELARNLKPAAFYIAVFMLCVGAILLNKETPFMYFRF